MQELLDDFPQKKDGLTSKQNRLVLLFLFAQLIFAGIAVGLAFCDIETIIFSGPVGSIIGLVVFALTHQSSFTVRKAIGLSAPIFSFICFLIIFILDWSPGEAEKPIAILMLLYTIVIFIGIMKEVLDYRAQSREWKEDILDF